MDDEQKQLSERLKAVESELKKITAALVGDYDKPGFMPTHLRVIDDIYGKEGKKGLAERLVDVENKYDNDRSWLRGAVYVSSGVGGLVVVLFELLFKVFHTVPK